MNFNAMVTEVLSIVKRPDKVNDIRREINATIRHFVTNCDFERDRAELLVAITPTEYTQAVALTSLTRFRKFWYVKRTGTTQYLSPMDTAKMGRNPCDMRDKYYTAGSNVNISMKALAAGLDIGYYQYPAILTGTETFWLSDMNPYMVIDRAASKIFTSIGDMQSAQRHEALGVSAYAAIVADIGVKG